MKPHASTHPFGRGFTPLFVIAVASLLTSCIYPKKYYDAHPDTRVMVGDKKAVVIYGTWSRVTAPTNHARINSYSLQWTGFDPVTRKLNGDGFGVIRRRCVSEEDRRKREKCNLDVTDWYVAVVPAGHYLLHYLAVRVGNLDINMMYGARSLLDPVARPGPAVAFEALAGHVTYIGDFLVHIDKGKPRIVAHERHDDDARDALRAYKGISGEMRYLEPTAIGPALQVRDGLPPKSPSAVAAAE